MKSNIGDKDYLAYEIREAVKRKYGPVPDVRITKRLREEWEALTRADVISDVKVLYGLTAWLKNEGIVYWLSYGAGASFILYILGVTSGNPLQPHLYCPKCHKIYWEPEYMDGFDIQSKHICQIDNTVLTPDGHNLPWQMLWGYGDNKVDFTVNIPIVYFERCISYFERKERHKKPSESAHESFSEGEDKLIFIGKVLLHFSKEVFSEKSFQNADIETEEEISQLHPRNFSEKMKVMGLKASVGGYDDKIQYMIDELGFELSELIAFRDDIYFYLRGLGLSEEKAWLYADQVRGTRGLPEILSYVMDTPDQWIIDRCNTISFILPKSHFVEEELMRENGKSWKKTY